MDVDAYLERIGCSGSREATAETLGQLHRSHLMTVPFENLDIALGRPIVLSLDSLFDKIVRQRRGGFCYELNGLFSWLLERLGFDVTLLSARVYERDQPGPEFDHLTLLVRLPGGRCLADVGFGDSSLEPIPLSAGEVPEYQTGNYRITGSDPALVLERRKEDHWERQYMFSLKPRALTEFGAMCVHHQTSPASHFTRNPVCSLATPDGRVTVSGRRAIVTTSAGREEREIADENEYRALLKEWFRIDLADVSRLWHR